MGNINGRIELHPRRDNIIARRATAWMLEITVAHLLLAPIAEAVYLTSSGIIPVDINYCNNRWPINWFFLWLYPLSWLPYLLFRDIFGAASFGKKIVGLKVTSDNSNKQNISKLRLVARNIVLCIPGLYIIEFFVIITDYKKMRRIGDFIAGTKVVESTRGAERRWHFLYISIFFFLVVNIHVKPWITIACYSLIQS